MTQPDMSYVVRAGIDDVASGRVDSGELHRALQHALDTHFRQSQPIRDLVRRPSPLRSSFGLEELDVALEGGTMLALVCKDLSREGMSPEARAAKPEFVYDPCREPEVYQTLLPGAQLGTAACYGVFQPAGAEQDRRWLFLERVAGQELGLVGDLDIWRQAAVWLAALHAQSQRRPELLGQVQHLLRYDHEYYHRWQVRVHTYLAQRSLHADTFREIVHILQVHSRAVELLLALPQLWIHGEFYASNVLVQSHAEGARICPVDWEMSAVGPGLVDLAALVAGKWQPEQREVMVEGYYGALAKHGMSQPSPADFATHLACCRLHAAVQWLGWSSTWSPPPAHAHDWLAEAHTLAAELAPVL